MTTLKRIDIDFELVAEHSPLVIYLIGEDGYFKYVNKRMCELSGYTREELLNMQFAQVVHPDFREFVIAQVNKRFKRNGAIPSYEFKAITKYGETRFVRGFFSIVSMGEGLFILGQILDVTENKKMEQELKNKEASLRETLEASNLGYFEVDLAGNFTYVNDALARTLGFPKEKLLGMNNRDYADFETAKKVYREFNKVYREGKPRTFFDWKLRTSTGRIVYVETSVDLIYNRNGEKVGFKGIARDITEEKRAKMALEERERYYRAIFEGSGTALMIIGEDTGIIEVNNTFEKLTGYLKQEVEGKMSWTEIVSDKDLNRMLGYHEKRRKDPDSVPTQYEFRYKNKAGNERWAIMNVSLLPQKRTAGSFIDITERKSMEEKLRFISFHDPLTGLYNRLYFDEELSRLQDSRYLPIALIIADLDGLKFINDNFGHKAGDNYIKDAANVLRSSVRGSDVVARIGGDEFAIVLPNSRAKNAKKVIERIRARINEFNNTIGKYPLSISMGFAVSSEDKLDTDSLISNADQAMYMEKQKKGVTRERLCMK